jgi:hypothetical protein
MSNVTIQAKRKSDRTKVEELRSNDYGELEINVASTGPIGAAHNRNIPAAATTHPGDDTTNTAEWTTAEGVTELSIRVIENTGAASTSALAYIVVINAPTATLAKAWLEDAGAIGQDVQYEMGYYGEALIIRRTTAITRADVLPIGDLGTSRFVIGAV